MLQYKSSKWQPVKVGAAANSTDLESWNVANFVKCANSVFRLFGVKSVLLVYTINCVYVFFLALQSSALSEISNQSFIYTMSTYVCARKSVYTNKHIKKIYRSFIADSDAAACCWILKFKQHYCGLASVSQTRGGVYCAGF